MVVEGGGGNVGVGWCSSPCQQDAAVDGEVVRVWFCCWWLMVVVMVMVMAVNVTVSP